MKKVLCLLGILWIGAAFLECGSAVTANEPVAEVGAEGGTCYPNNTCNEGLNCYSNLCVRTAAGEDGGITANTCDCPAAPAPYKPVSITGGTAGELDLTGIDMKNNIVTTFSRQYGAYASYFIKTGKIVEAASTGSPGYVKLYYATSNCSGTAYAGEEYGNIRAAIKDGHVWLVAWHKGLTPIQIQSVYMYNMASSSMGACGPDLIDRPGATALYEYIETSLPTHLAFPLHLNNL